MIGLENSKSGSMKYRIAMWASAGLLVAGCWHLYVLATFPMQITSEPIVWTLVRLTCPIAFAGFHFHFPVSIYWFFLANAATYALVGLIVETLRQQLHHAKN
jgi:hypothetical protein